MLTIDVKAAPFTKQIGRHAKQVPFAAAVALNRTANKFQDAARKRLGRKFELRRRTFLERGVAKISRSDRANKRRLSVRIHVDPRVSFLEKFEKGRRKVPRGAHLAIPSREVPRTAAGVVRRNLRPSALQLHRQGQSVKGQRRTFLVPGVGVFQRFGRKGNTSVRLLFSFKSSAPTPRTLGFELTARRTVRDEYDRQFIVAWNQAIRTSRRP